MGVRRKLGKDIRVNSSVERSLHGSNVGIRRGSIRFERLHETHM
jgi:hypothetical protein